MPYKKRLKQRMASKLRRCREGSGAGVEGEGKGGEGVSDLNRGKKGLGGRNHSMGVWFTGMTPADARA